MGRPSEQPLLQAVAYIIYTSGSTGRPKGVAVSHQGLCNMVREQVRLFGLGPESRVLQFASPSFDASVWETFMALGSGARLCLPGEDRLLPGPELAALLRQQLITHVTLPPTALSHLPFESFPDLDLIVTAGEACPQTLVDRWAPQRRFFNAYGPTETTVCATVAPCSPNEPVTIGRPLANTRIYLLDRFLRLVPTGVPGELFIAGRALARGYHARPRLTAAAFLPDPFATQPGRRLYRSGDRARYRFDGNIEFLGRTDHQVKLRGFRIELGEIETVLATFPSIREAAAIIHENRLYAFAAASPGQHETGPREYLAQRLPDYMVPAAVFTSDRLPRTPAGKVDRAALALQVRPHPVETGEYSPPRTGKEQVLADIWVEILGLDAGALSRNANFFELGGDSILAIRFVSRAQQEGLLLTPKQVFRFQTLAELAAAAGAAAPVRAEQGAVTGPVPLTPIQRWFFQLDQPDPHHFNQALLFETSHQLSAKLLAGALSAVGLHHDAVRLRFRKTETGWLQAHGEGDIRLEEVVLHETGDAWSGAVERVAARVQAGLDLERGPLMRAVLFYGGRGPRRLLLVSHHLIVDGISWRILLEDLVSAYHQLERGQPVRLPAKTTSFREWAHRLEDFARSPAFAETLYRQRLRGEHPGLPTDFPEQDIPVSRARSLRSGLDKKRTHALLHQVSRAYRTRIDDLLLAALLRAVTGWSGRCSLLTDLESHGREALFEDLDLSRTAGWFTALYPVLLTLPESPDPAALIKTVKERLRAVPHGGIGYGLARYYLDDARFQGEPAPIVFNYLGQLDRTGLDTGLLKPAPESTGPAWSPDNRRTHLLEINGSVRNDRLNLTWTFDPNIHREETIRARAEEYITVLGELIDHCLIPETGGVTPSDFPLAAIDQASLDAVAEQPHDLEDLYPLSPLQAGLLFHARYHSGPDPYIQQIHCLLRGPLDQTAFERAWLRVLERHPILRTSFIWEGLDQPLQMVRRKVDLPIAVHDWRLLSPRERQSRESAFLAGDLRRDFAPGCPPLMRLSLLRHDDELTRLVWTHHHLLLDGWSLPILVRELFTGYEAFIRGEEPETDPVRPYRDFIRWLQERREKDAETFWTGFLEPFETPSLVEGDRVAEAGAPSGRDSRRLELDEPLTAALESRTRAGHLTLNTLIQGCWAFLLSRYCGSREVIFGVTVAGRSPDLPGSESMVGLFINTLPLGLRLPDQTTAREWLQQLQERRSQWEPHVHVPLSDIHGWSRIPRDQPLFESIVVFENYPVDDTLLRQRGTLAVAEVGGFDQTGYPLALLASPGPRLSLRLLFDAGRFSPGFIERLLTRMEALLAGFAAAPDRPVASWNLLSPGERQQVLHTFNETGSGPGPACIHHLFQAQAGRTPQAEALSLAGETVSYSELKTRANRLAHFLCRRGVGPDTLVAVSMERSIHMAVSVLAVLQAGAAYIPLDPAYPENRRRFMLADARAAVLLTRNPTTGHEGVPAICLEEARPSVAACPDTDPAVAVHPENLAYVIYTSGSTGRPKGVAMPHRTLANLVQQQIDLRPEPLRTLQFASLSFDVSFQEFFSTWCSGGALLLIDESLRMDFTAMLRLISQQHVQRLFLPFVALNHLAETVRDTGLLPSSLRQVITAGEQLQVTPAVAAFFEALPDCELHNHYGPTESHVVTAHQLRGAPGNWPTLPPIGTPIDGTRVFLLDALLEPVPPGLAGELFLGGQAPARGYLNRPATTAERFVPDPFTTRPGLRLYRTGDLGRYLDDGSIQFLGRLDHQVKLRGFRIEPGEIETVLARYDGIRAAAVLVREDQPGSRMLAAYITGVRVETAALRKFLTDRLPAFMVPAAFVFLDAFPLTSSGKLDRRALPAPEESAGAYAAPRDEVERRIAEIWARVLVLEKVGIHDNFFELGGHSLTAMQVISRITPALGVTLSPRHLFEEPTVACLAERVRFLLQAAAQGQAPEEEIADDEEEIRL